MFVRHSLDKARRSLIGFRRSTKEEGFHPNKALLEQSESDDGWKDQDVFLASDDGDSVDKEGKEDDDSDDDSDSSDEDGSDKEDDDEPEEAQEEEAQAAPEKPAEGEMQQEKQQEMDSPEKQPAAEEEVEIEEDSPEKDGVAKGPKGKKVDKALQAKQKLEQQMAKERQKRAAARRANPSLPILSYADEEAELKEIARQECILEWRIEIANQVIKLRQKVADARQRYKKRHSKLEKKFKAQIERKRQANFLKGFNTNLYHANMTKLADPAKKKKELGKILDIMDQYDFYFRHVVFNGLFNDQSKEKNPNLRGTININFQLNEVLEAQVNYEEYEQQLQMTFVGSVTTIQPCKIPFDLYDYPHISGFQENMHRAKQQALITGEDIYGEDYVPPLDPVYEQKQSKEIQKLCFTELKLFDYLITGLAQLQRNLRNITALWGKDLGLNQKQSQARAPQNDDDGDQRKRGPENTPQDIRTHLYLQSLANFIETERVTLAGVQQQVLKSLTKAVEKKLSDHDKAARNATKEKFEFIQQLEMIRYDMGARGGNVDEQYEIDQKAVEQKYGKEPTDAAKVFSGEDLLAFDKYLDFQEGLNYTFMLHCLRMILLIKLVNKSTQLRAQERAQKQQKAQARSSSAGIEMDLFQINQVLKNEIGKDVDMIEVYFQESLKAIYITISEYLQNVPLEEPDYLKGDEEPQEYQKEQQNNQIMIKDQNSIIDSEEMDELHEIRELRETDKHQGDQSTIYQDRTALMDKEVSMITDKQRKSQFTRGTRNAATIDDNRSYLMSNSQLGRFPDVSDSDEPVEEYVINKNISPNQLDTQSSQSAFPIGEGPGENSIIKETEVAKLEDMQNDEFQTLRMKKLIVAVLAEFKTVNIHFGLNDEEQQQFRTLNNLAKDPISDLEGTNSGNVKKSNLQTIGQNAEDLRLFIIYSHQSHLKYLEEGEEPMFNPLKPVPQLLVQENQLQYPFNRYKSVLKELEKRQKAEKRRLAKERNLELQIEKLNQESNVNQLSNTLFSQTLKQDKKSVNSIKQKKLEAAVALFQDFKRLNLDERLSVMVQFCLIAKAIEIRTKREEQDMLLANEEDSLGSGYGLEKRDDSKKGKKENFETKNQKRYAELIGQYLVQQADLYYQTAEYQKIIYSIYERILTEEDKQFKLDVEDIIEEHISQCVQFLSNEEMLIDENGNLLGPDSGAAKMGGVSTFLSGLADQDGIEHKNLLLEVLSRELTGKGNYLNIDGQSLSIKDYLRDWKTDNLYQTVCSSENYDYLNIYQSQIQKIVEIQRQRYPGQFPSIFSKFGTGKISINAEVAFSAAHTFKGYIERTGNPQPEKLIKPEIKQGGIYKRLADRYTHHNYNSNQQQNGIQIEFFKNLTNGGWNGQEISHTKHLFDYQELDELIDLDKRTQGFQKLQQTPSIVGADFKRASGLGLQQKNSLAQKQPVGEENPMELISPKSQQSKTQKSNNSKRL